MYALTELQLAIMDVLWKHGEAGVQDVHEALFASRHTREFTVASILSRLEARGIVGRRKEGRTNIYSPAIARQEARSDVVGEFLERVSSLFAEGTPDIVRELVDSDSIRLDELREIRELVDRRERELRGSSDPPDSP